MEKSDYPVLLIPDTFVCANGLIAGKTLRQYQTINRLREWYPWVQPPVGCGPGCSCAKSMRGRWS